MASYSKERYEKNKYLYKRKTEYCILEGCGRPIERFVIPSLKKFCCLDHSKEYNKAYIRNWHLNNKDKLIAAKQRFLAKKNNTN